MSDGPTRRDAARMIAAVPAAVPAALRALAANDQLVFGSIGCGARGRYLLTHFRNIAGARCGALCDLNDANLGEAQPVLRGRTEGVRDYRRLLERHDIQAAVIATPPHTHFAIARDALLAGKHVFCENTLVFKPEEVHALRELAGKHNQVIQTGLQRRYSNFYQVARQMAVKGFLGDVTNIQAQWHRNRTWTMQPGASRESNWRLYREFSGGLTAELAAHQIDVANWVFNDAPEFVTGVGSLDWKKDGRDIYDSIALIFRYPEGRQLTVTSISTNRHLPMFNGERTESGEVVMGTEGAIELTFGTGEERPFGLWFYDPTAPKVSKAEAQKEFAFTAGATLGSSVGGMRVMPLLLARDQFTGEESFVQRELKWARRWLYAKGIMVPEEDRHPVQEQLEGFVECCRAGTRPKADIEAGLRVSTAVLMANRAMDEGRRVHAAEFEKR